MSAYIVSPKTIAKIAVLHSVFTEYQWPKHDDIQNTIKTAGMLLRANIKSIATRYSDTKGKEIESFYTDLTAAGYKKEMIDAIDQYASTIYRKQDSLMRDISTAVSEYIYQSCEYKGFYKSAAYIAALETSHNAASKLNRN
jgi:hypothetical protein